MSTHPTLPVLRRGQTYDSLDHAELKSVRTGEPVARIGQANAALIRRDLRRQSRACLRDIPVADLLAMCAEAGAHFMEGTLPAGDTSQSPAEFIGALSETSGLPHALVRRNMAKIHQVFTQMPTILKGLTRGLDLSILDKGSGVQGGVPISYFAVADSLGVVLPSNSPGVNSLWMPAIPLKVPLVLKPGKDEPWTPLRIVQSFIAAGVPAEAFSFYPTDHEGSAAIMDACSRALIFGDQSTVERYASNPGVQVHGPGWSKVLVGEDWVDRWPELLDILATSVSANGGRSCINASAIVVPRHGREIADALAKKLSEVVPCAADDPDAVLSGFANPKMAEFMDAAVDEGLKTPGAENASAPFQPEGRKVERDGSTYLLPTVVRCDAFSHPLANKEYLFPYTSVVEVPQAQMLDQIGPSLVVTALTADPDFVRDLLASPLIERLNVGEIPTSHVEWDQPHEGNLFEFLYRRRSIQWAAGSR